MTRVRRAKFIGADAKMSCPAGIPIHLHAHSVFICPPPSGIPF